MPAFLVLFFNGVLEGIGLQSTPHLPACDHAYITIILRGAGDAIIPTCTAIAGTLLLS